MSPPRTPVLAYIHRSKRGDEFGWVSSPCTRVRRCVCTPMVFCFWIDVQVSFLCEWHFHVAWVWIFFVRTCSSCGFETIGVKLSRIPFSIRECESNIFINSQINFPFKTQLINYVISFTLIYNPNLYQIAWFQPSKGIERFFVQAWHQIIDYMNNKCITIDQIISAMAM